MSGGVDSSVTAALLVEQGYEVTACRCACGKASGAAGMLGSSRRRGSRRASGHSPHIARFARAICRDRWSSRLRKIICAAARPIPASRAIVISNSARCCAGPRSRTRITSPPVITPTSFTARIADACSAAARCGRRKDQSYFLFALSQAQLARTLFPLGGMQKTAVREKARAVGLPAAERPESQDICFGDYKALVASYAEEIELAGGEVVDRAGKVLGQHGGVHTVTVGQRRGLGISARGTALRRRHRRRPSASLSVRRMT